MTNINYLHYKREHCKPNMYLKYSLTAIKFHYNLNQLLHHIFLSYNNKWKISCKPNSEHFYFLCPMEATCIIGKNNDASMDGRVERKSRRLKEEATSRMRHTSKYHFEDEPICKTTTCTLNQKFSASKLSLKEEKN